MENVIQTRGGLCNELICSSSYLYPIPIDNSQLTISLLSKANAKAKSKIQTDKEYVVAVGRHTGISSGFWAREMSVRAPYFLPFCIER